MNYPTNDDLNRIARDAHSRIVKECIKRGKTPPTIVVILSEPEYCAVARSVGMDDVLLAIRRAAMQVRKTLKDIRKAKQEPAS